jgi:rod shape determining protein RodA
MPSLPGPLSIAANWPVFVAVAVLSALSVVSIWADSPSEGMKQLVFLAIGAGLLMSIQLVSYQVLGRWAWGFYIASLLLIIYTVAASTIGGDNPLPFVSRVNGSYAWIRFNIPGLGPFSFQPAEMTKIAFVLVLARYLRFRSNYRTLVGLLPPFALALFPILLILKQPDMGTAMTFIPALLAMLFVAGAKIRHMAMIIGMGLALVPIAWFSGTDKPVFRHMPSILKEYQRDRVYAMFSKDPATLQRTGFQQEHALIAFGSGGWSGKGVLTIPVGQRVPERHNDMIFALIGEQFGFIGAAAVLAAYVVLFAAGVEISGSTREPFARLVALGIVALLAGQTFINLLVALRMMPVTGVTLPFVSYGGSSLLASFIAAGLLLNIGQNRPIVMANDPFEHAD